MHTIFTQHNVLFTVFVLYICVSISSPQVIGLQTHTMAPVNLICKGFLRSLADSDHPLASRGKPQQSARASSTNGVAFDYIDYDQPMLLDDDDDDDVITSDPFTKAKLDARKQQLTSHQPNKPDRNTSADNHSLDLQLRHLMHRTFALSIWFIWKDTSFHNNFLLHLIKGMQLNEWFFWLVFVRDDNYQIQAHVIQGNQ